MTVVTSTVPAVKAALLALIRARPNLANITVAWTFIPVDDQAYESVFFDWSLEDATEEDRSLGDITRTEQYVIPVVARVYGPGDLDGQETETRAFALASEVEAAVRENNRLGLSNVESAVVVGMPSANALYNDGVVTEVTVRVRVRARKHR